MPLNNILPEAIRLCRHGITANFANSDSEQNNFICAFEIKPESNLKFDRIRKPEPEKVDKNYKGKKFWLTRLKVNKEADRVVTYY